MKMSITKLLAVSVLSVLATGCVTRTIVVPAQGGGAPGAQVVVQERWAEPGTISGTGWSVTLPAQGAQCQYRIDYPQGSADAMRAEREAYDAAQRRFNCR